MNTKLNAVLNEEKIQLNHEKLRNNMLGCYYSIKGIHLIIIEKSIIHNEKIYNTILAEELGHHFTSNGTNVPYVHNLYLQDLNYYKSEDAALRWSVNFMIPTNELLSFISNNETTNIYDLSQEFEVTQDFIRFKFNYMALEKSKFKVDSDRFLVLSELPSLIIQERSS